jgi:hypothetical protein
MQFKVPQFIDVEDTIFGPFTFKQFAYLAGGAGAAFVIYKIMPLWIGIFLILPIVGLALALTFYKLNGKPFAYYLQASINYALTSKLYIWKQKINKVGDKKEEEKVPAQVSVVPTLSGSRLSDLSWSLDVLDKQK